MLTPQEVSAKQFVKAVFGGYDMSAVDEFLEALTEDYSSLYKENAILKSKIKVLVEKVEEYRSTEDAMRMALLNAQKMGDDLMSDSKRKSEAMLSEADQMIKNRKTELNREIADENARLQAVRDSTAKFVEASQEIMRQHSLFLSKLSELKTPDPIPVQQEPVQNKVNKEEEILDTARQIDSFVSKMLSTEPEASAPKAAGPAEPSEEVDEPTRLYRRNTTADWSDDDEPTSPRPKFDFNNLQFGSNYTDGK